MFGDGPMGMTLSKDSKGEALSPQLAGRGGGFYHRNLLVGYVAVITVT